MIQAFYTAYTLLTAIVLVAAFAVWKGGWPERVGAGLNLFIALCFLLAQRNLEAGGLATAALVVDGLLALGFLALTVRFAKIWLGVAMLLQAAQFSLHAFYYVSERGHDYLFAAVNNVVSWSVLAAILFGVVGHWIAEARKKRAVLNAAAAGPM